MGLSICVRWNTHVAYDAAGASDAEDDEDEDEEDEEEDDDDDEEEEEQEEDSQAEDDEALLLACASGAEVFVSRPVVGGYHLLTLDIGSDVYALAAFEEPATGAPRLACGTGEWGEKIGDVRIFDAVAGGDALLVLEIGSNVESLAIFKEPATSAPRLACGCNDRKLYVFDPPHVNLE